MTAELIVFSICWLSFVTVYVLIWLAIREVLRRF